MKLKMKSKTVSTLAVEVIGPHYFCCIMHFYSFVLIFCLLSFQILDLSVCISSQRATTLKTTRSICSLERTLLMESKSAKLHTPESDSCARYRYSLHIHTPKAPQIHGKFEHSSGLFSQKNTLGDCFHLIFLCRRHD